MGVTKRIKILMGIPSKEIKMGGPVTHLPYLVDYFENNEQFKIQTFIYGSKIDVGSHFDKHECILNKIINTLHVFLIFVYYNVTFRPHIIHINTAFDKKSLFRDIPFSLFSFVFRKNLIFKIHGSSYQLINTRSKFLLFLIKLFFLGAHKVGVLSEIEKNEFITKFGYLNKIVVVKNIVLQKDQAETKKINYFTRDSSKSYGLFVSRIVKGKGLDDIIKALPLVLKTNPHFNLVVAGNGPEKASCTELANELKVEDSIIWLGIIPNDLLLYVYLSCDIFIFPSHLPEGMPMALIEALKCGIPIITTRVRFALNYLEENSNCLFIATGNINDIALKINTLIFNQDLQMTMKMANPEKIKEFSQYKVGKEFEAIYLQLLNQ